MSMVFFLATLLFGGACPAAFFAGLIGLALKKPWGKRGMKISGLCLIAAIVSFVGFGVVAVNEDDAGESDSHSDKVVVSENKEQVDDRENTDIVVEGETIVDFYRVIDLVGIDHEDAEDVEKIDDWYGGPRYSFKTEGTTARVYCNMDGTINSLKVGNDIDLYKQGFEPWKIENFLVSESDKNNLIYCTQEAVSSCLNYPSTADYPLLDWSFGRQFNRYTVNSYVEAKNAFCVPDKLNFTAGYWIEDGDIRLIYLMLDGDIVLDDSEDYQNPEREEIPVDTVEEVANEIRLIDGQIGNYGKTVNLDGWDYIWYMVPAGKYEMTCNTKQCVVYVDKNDITKNSDGYVEMKTVATYEMEYQESETIEIRDDEHIFMAINADVTLVTID